MSVASTLLLTAALFTASAAEVDGAHTDDDESWSSIPIYLQARGGLAVPARSNGDVVSAGLSVGILTSDTQAFGMRFIYMHSPPENPLANKTPPLPYAWGPVVDWTYTAQPDKRASIFTTVSAGYVYGVPEDEKFDNVILPILEGGIGLRFSRRMEDGRVLYVAPELGLVPGAVAPMSALNVGMILPGSSKKSNSSASRASGSDSAWGGAQ